MLLGRIPDGGGWRARGGTKSPIRYDYVHSLVDDHFRLTHSEILPAEKGPTCAGFLTRAAAYFAAHGITRIERIMTDNAWAHRWSVSRILCKGPVGVHRWGSMRSRAGGSWDFVER